MPDSFRSFINKFKPVKLPLTISIYSITVKDLIQVDDKSSDTLFIKGNESIYEILNDTTDFYYLITCQPADAYVPILNIYNKKGEKLSSESLVVRGCGGGPGIEYCSSTAIIKNDLTIYCADTTKSFEYDSIMRPIPNSRQVICLYKDGKINPDGTINMSDEKRKKIE